MTNTSYPPTVEAQGQGTFIDGLTTINVTATSSGGRAYGVIANNQKGSGTVTPTTEVVLNQVDITATGENGASSYGIYGSNQADITVESGGTITAVGDNATGLYLTSSEITFGGDTTVTGDTTGIELLLGTMNLSENATVTTNTMSASTGDTNLSSNSSLSVTGIEGGHSYLGTVNAEDAENANVSVGTGAFTIGSYTGDSKSVTFTDLAGNDGTTIQSLTGETTFIADQSSNDQYASALEAAQALGKAVTVEGETVDDSYDIVIEEGTLNDSLKGHRLGDQTIVVDSVTKNSFVDGFGSVSALSALQWRHEMNSLNKRMGELRQSPAGIGTWARLYGSEMEYGAQSVTSKNTTLQVGTDVAVGNWKIGIAANYTEGDSDYDNGEADTKNYGFAVYGSWLSESGGYVDLIAKYSRLENDFLLSDHYGSYDNNALSFSAEFGHHFKFMDDRVFVEPQIGVAYGYVNSADFKTNDGIRIEQDSYESLIGRIGVRTGFTFPDNKGSIYARVSGVYDFKGELDSHFSMDGSASTNFSYEDLGGSWVEYGIGANFNWTDNTYTYIDLERTSGGEVNENYRWNIGLRHVF